jgi:hypothetical protein
VSATKERGTPAARQRAGKKGDGIRRTTGRAIQQKLLFGFSARTPRQKIDDAAHCASAIQRRRYAFDDLDLPEVHRRNLEEPKPANLTKQWQAVGEHSRVSAPHALDANTRGTERRRGRVYSHPAHFVQHHDDVPWCHEHLFFDLFADQDVDPHELILEPLVGTRRRHDRDSLLDGRLCLQLHHDVLRGAGCHLHRCGRRSEARFQNGDLDRAGDGDDGRCTTRIGPMGRACDDDSASSTGFSEART